jgi:hypothetical protein
MEIWTDKLTRNKKDHLDYIYESLLSLNIFNALYEPAGLFHAF